MANIFENHSSDTVFRDRYVLTPEYVPNKMPGREHETKRMVEILSVLLDPYRTNAVNLAIVGEAGIGKTTLAKRVTNDLKEYALETKINLDVCYVNCHSLRTKTAILRKLSHNNYTIQGRGFSDEELMEMLATKLEKQNKRQVLIIDEAGMLKAEDILGIIHLNELFMNLTGRLSTISITRNSDWSSLLDSRLSGRIHDKIELKPYNREEISNILNIRRKLGFHAGILSDEILELVIDATTRSRNARHGIEILLRAGMIANANGESQVTADFIRAANTEIYPELRSDIFRDLRFNELATSIAIGRILSNNEKTTTTINYSYEIFKLVCAENKGTPAPGVATFRNAINTLTRLGILAAKVKPVEEEKRGRRTVIGLLDMPAIVLVERAQSIMNELQNKDYQ